MNVKYFNYLCSMIENAEEYSVLLRELYDKEFYSLVPNDQNRISDGLDLRDEYYNKYGIVVDTMLCTVLEMLLALSNKLVFETVGGEYEKTQSEWFFIMLDNLCLETYTDEYVRPGLDIIRLNDKIDKFINRKYDKHGIGGLFPLKNPAHDQRKVEIWYQMSAYIMENYF